MRTIRSHRRPATLLGALLVSFLLAGCSVGEETPPAPVVPAPAAEQPAPDPVPVTPVQAAPLEAAAPAGGATAPTESSAETPLDAPESTGRAATPPSLPDPAVAIAEPSNQIAALPNGFHVQLGAFADRETAMAALDRMTARHADLLGAIPSAIAPIDKGGAVGVVHVIQAGVFSLRSGALKLCRALKDRGEDCFIIAPTP